MKVLSYPFALVFLNALLFAASPDPNFGRIPLTFEENLGQFQNDVNFASRGGHHLFTFKPQQFELNLRTNTGSDQIVTTLINSSPTASMSATELSGMVNYLIGADPAKWLRNVPTYRRIRYKSVYQGIDLLYYGNERNLEYTFVVAPQSNPKQIALRLAGAKKATVLANGSLKLQLAHGIVTWKRPVVYQLRGEKRQLVAARFELNRNVLKFRLGEYDHDRELIIDPELVWSTYIGTLDVFVAQPHLTTDSAGNAYITGATSSADWPLKPGAFDSTFEGNPHDLFVTKLNATGTGLVYSTFIGGNGYEDVSDIAVDKNGSVYLVGQTNSSNFPHTSGAFSSTHASTFWGYLLKLNSSGSGLDYAASLPSIDVHGVAVDSGGNAYFTGAVRIEDLPLTTPGAFRSSHGDLVSCGDTFSDLHTASYVWEMNASGSAPLLVTYLSDCENGTSIALDKNGNIFVAGRSGDRHFVTPGAFQTVFGGFADGFVTVLNPSGTAAKYSTYYGGQVNDVINAIAVDSSGNVSMTGYTGSPDIPLRNAFQDQVNAHIPAFVAKLNSDGSQLIFGTYLGGLWDSVGIDVAVDSQGRTFVAGYSNSYNFITHRAFQGICGIADFIGQCDLTTFVAGFDSNGTNLYSTWIGTKLGMGGGALGITSDAQGNVTIAGLTAAGYPVTAGAYRTQPPLTGSHQFAFVSKISPTLTPGCTLNRTHPSVTICSPLDGATLKSPVYLNALTNFNLRINAMQVYVDGVLKLEDFNVYIMDTFLQLSPGTHRVSVKAWAGTQAYLSVANVTASGTATQPACRAAAILSSLTVCSPLAGSVVQANNVHVLAVARSSSRPISAYKIYVDGVGTLTSHSAALDSFISLTPGLHRLSVKAWATNGEIMMERVYVTAQ